jgi:phospho-N-acetylmuramoyl-pentapeptide-transferase
MFYNLIYPLHDHLSALNVFRYVTFRSIGSALTAFLILFVFEPAFIRWLKSRQIGQVVRDDGPESHFSKRGVPTMGGLLMLVAIAASTLLWADLSRGLIWVCLLLTLFYGLIGMVDDWRKVTKSSSKGLSARGKLILQISGGLVVGLYLHLHPAYDGGLSLPFCKGVRPDLGWWYLPFAVAVIVGASNAVNLTDGLDGLAAGPVMIASSVYLIFAYAVGNAAVAHYLQIPYVAGADEVAVFCAAVAGACLGFLWYNTYPAQVFMGDVGSLALGGALGTVAIIIKQEILLAIVGGIFVMEALSVIIQVLYFKASGGRRVFLMSPFHHHFEKKGWPEPKVVVRFWIISIILGLMALATLKLR